VVITLPLLEGLDGVQKMSKSLGNYIGITEPPDAMFGKIMSLSDQLMWRYFELLSAREMSVIEAWQAAVREGANPRDIKFELAAEMVTRFHSAEAARVAQERFIARFQQGVIPEDLIEITVAADDSGGLSIARLLKDAGLVKSTSEALRLIGQGGVRIDGDRVEDPHLMCPVDAGHIYQVGKRRVAKVRVAPNA
jgi:tyrosyl-tRNA synthetase